MARRRMFSLDVIDTDLFLEMPPSTQNLYFHLAMRADDDGFLANTKKIMKSINASDDDLRVLLAKQFVIMSDTGICVIRHWRIHNYLRSDRYKPTIYQNEKKDIIEENGVYNVDSGIPLVDNRYPQVRLGKDRLEIEQEQDTDSQERSDTSYPPPSPNQKEKKKKKASHYLLQLLDEKRGIPLADRPSVKDLSQLKMIGEVTADISEKVNVSVEEAEELFAAAAWKLYGEDDFFKKQGWTIGGVLFNRQKIEAKVLDSHAQKVKLEESRNKQWYDPPQ